LTGASGAEAHSGNNYCNNCESLIDENLLVEVGNEYADEVKSGNCHVGSLNHQFQKSALPAVLYSALNIVKGVRQMDSLTSSRPACWWALRIDARIAFLLKRISKKVAETIAPGIAAWR